MTDIKIIRLLGVADDIICQVEKSNGKFRLKDPIILRMVPEQTDEVDPDSQQKRIRFSVAMAPFMMPYMKGNTIACDKCQIVLEVEPTDEVVEKYNSIFSPVIHRAVPKIITP